MQFSNIQKKSANKPHVYVIPAEATNAALILFLRCCRHLFWNKEMTLYFQGTLDFELHWYPKFYNQVILFVGLKT